MKKMDTGCSPRENGDSILTCIAPRFKTTFFPFVIILTGLILGCSVLHYIVFIRPAMFIYNPDLYFILIPAVLCFFAVIFWLRPILCKLVFERSYLSCLFVVHIGAIGLMTMVVYYSQIWLEDSLTTIVHVQDVSELREQYAAKFFSVKQYEIKKELFGYHFLMKEQRAKNGQTSLVLDLFFVFPVFSTLNQTPVVWLGINFHEKTGDYMYRKDLEPLRMRFVNHSMHQILTMPIEKFYYLELLRDNFTINGFNKAVEKSKLKISHPTTVLLGSYKPFRDRLSEDRASFIVVSIIALFSWIALIALLATDDPKILLQDPK